MEQTVEWGLLLDYYGELLTDRQRELCEMSFNQDLSLSEIAENTGISRQGVRDQLTHAETQLTFYEDALGLLAKNTAVSALLADINGMECVKNNAELAGKLEKIRAVLNLE